ncbi:conserved hypothetical protein [Talaromyces stipitatus ATCC 10500]|uniref:Endonuclease/exonuclease/phosphatase domain-containing protein n=1 Tax=Talaromyces stipitatus (strain ATCC 10500 / CBS 375.48 / QM 6759 / NRRL 1006) TaxID=441959 RepID=B8MU91_TALSN|nr:uncharacterized protein TSTA_107860 [Talaromyces stipitatus ATCC 10500]EED11595.1 conserved hypothetical protein [Talaromyces stipitatus ATCC 10500]
MLWVRSDIEAEQIPVASPDLTATILQLPDRAVLIVSAYVVENSEEALISTIRLLRSLVADIQGRGGTRTDVLIMGDFNRHDQLWGGDQISPMRQGEADDLVDFMTEYSLHSLLPRGTKTWQLGDRETTIDLVLASTELAEEMVQCDHQAIETEFDISVPDQPVNERLLLKNAPWAEIRSRIATNLQVVPLGDSVQEQTDHLMTVVTKAVQELTPRAKPSPYAKRCGSPFSDKIPPLVRSDGSTTKDKVEQAKELLATFFPPLPVRIEDEGTQQQREPVHMPDLTLEEIEWKVFEAKPWKAPGEDGLPAMV